MGIKSGEILFRSISLNQIILSILLSKVDRMKWTECTIWKSIFIILINDINSRKFVCIQLEGKIF